MMICSYRQVTFVAYFLNEYVSQYSSEDKPQLSLLFYL